MPPRGSREARSLRSTSNSFAIILEAIHWNKQAPAPSLPEDVVERTLAKYLEAFQRLTGRQL